MPRSSKKSREKRAKSMEELRTYLFDVDEDGANWYDYLRSVEQRHRPQPGYTQKQRHITYSVRSILVNWLVEVAEDFELRNDTLHFAVSYLDRYLSDRSATTATLQLVGAAAMCLAAKHQEMYPPTPCDFAYITDGAYMKELVSTMEQLILEKLSFDVNAPTPLCFLTEYYAIRDDVSERIKFLATYLCELSMLEGRTHFQFLPSRLAASAIALARYTLLEQTWPRKLELSTGYNLKDLQECIMCLNKTFCVALNIRQQAIQEKYKSSEYGHVALLLPLPIDNITPTSEDEEENA